MITLYLPLLFWIVDQKQQKKITKNQMMMDSMTLSKCMEVCFRRPQQTKMMMMMFLRKKTKRMMPIGKWNSSSLELFSLLFYFEMNHKSILSFFLLLFWIFRSAFLAPKVENFTIGKSGKTKCNMSSV